MTFRAPKYQCTICNKTFRSRNSHWRHIDRAHNKISSSESATGSQGQEIEIEVPYIGREYTFSGLATGNRHMRAGIPFINDPLRRNIQPKVQPKSMESLGPIPRLSKYRNQAI